MSALDNKAVVRRWVEALNNGTWREAADALFTTTFVGHAPYAPAGLAAGPQGTKDVVAALSAGFPDAQLTVEDQIAEGDKVTTRYTAGHPSRCVHGHCSDGQACDGGGDQHRPR